MNINFSQHYFRSKSEWNYFLSQCNIPETIYAQVETVNIEAFHQDIEVEYQDNLQEAEEQG